MLIREYGVVLSNNRLPKLVVETEKYVPGVEQCNNPNCCKIIMDTMFSLSYRGEEFVYAIALSSKYDVIGVFQISHGSINYSILRPREVLQRALLLGASELIVVHNHPSYNCDMSKMDLRTFNTLQDACKLLSVPLLDFIIIGGNNIFSMRENYPNLFKEVT